MVDNDVDEMFKIGLFSFATGHNGKDLIDAIKNGRVYEYCDMVKRVTASSENDFDNEDTRTQFIELLFSSFENNDDLIISDEEYADEIMKIVDDSTIVLTSDRVRDLYKGCLFKDSELENGKPTLPFSIGDGVKSSVYFNASRLEETESEIVEMVAQLPNIDEGTSFLDLNIDKNNRFWTDDYQTVDMLVQLGVATGSLEYVQPKRELNATMPSLILNKEKVMNTAKKYKKC